VTSLLLEGTLTGFRMMSHYSRYSVQGLSNLLDGESGMLVGYHGRPFTLDYYYLSARMHAEQGRYPRAVVLRSVKNVPVLRRLVSDARMFYGPPDEAAITELRGRREHVYVCPGGLHEALRPAWRGRYRVDWSGRHGYLRLAVRHGLPIYPSAALGVDEAYIGLNDGYALGRRLGVPGAPLWLGVGALGLWPFALPWPTKITHRIGTAIDLKPLRAEIDHDETFYLAADWLVRSQVQALLNDLKNDARSTTERRGTEQ